MNKFQFSIIILLIIFTNFFLFFLNSENGNKLIKKFDNLLIAKDINSKNFEINDELFILLREGKNTFYIRHAPKPKNRSAGLQRLSLQRNFINNEMVKKSSCLSDIGKAEAYFIGKILSDAKIPIGEVYSSPLCRAVETAEIAFNKIDYIEDFLLYDGIINDKLKKSNLVKFKNLFYSIPKNKNKIISAHGHRLKKIGIDYGTDESGIIIYNHDLNKVIYVAYNLNDLAKMYYHLED